MKEEKGNTGEQEIIEKVRSGDNKAIKMLYKSGFPAVHRFIIKNQGDADDAAEIYQQAFIVLYERLQTEDFTLQSTAGTFLFAVARNLWMATLKERKRFSTGQDWDLDGYESGTQMMMPEILAKEREYDIMESSIEHLGEPCRSLLKAFYHEKLSMEEIANRMGYTNADNAKNQKYKCIVRLRRIFDKRMKMDQISDQTEEK